MDKMNTRVETSTSTPNTSPLRLQVYDHIQRHPAAHILELAENFGLTHPTMMYHLGVLESEGYIISSLWGKRRVHFDTQSHYTAWEREVLAVLALDEARAIMHHVCEKPGTFPRELARELKISETTVKRYVPELLRLSVFKEEEGSFRRRLRISRTFRRRGSALLTKLPAEARPRSHLEALVGDVGP